MKKQTLLGVVCSHRLGFALLFLSSVQGPSTQAAPATLLFEDNFTGGIPGWTAVQPSGGNESFEVHVIGWNAFLATPDFDPGSEHVVPFSDTNHATGRIGFGLWGQGGFGSPNAQV